MHKIRKTNLSITLDLIKVHLYLLILSLTKTKMMNCYSKTLHLYTKSNRCVTI